MTPLLKLEPTWIKRDDRVVGVRFLCPIDDGAGPHIEGHSVCVLFSNPPDGGPAHPNDPSCPGNNDGERWTRSGPGLKALTLSPSVDCTRGTRCPKSEHSSCSHTHCFHGHVQNGVVA